MLFDLQSGKRRRVVQVVYGGLAASFLIGFVFFGVGSGGIGSISDVLGLGNGSSGGDVSHQWDDQIDSAQSKLETHPKDERAMLQLAKYQYLKGKDEVTEDANGIVVTDQAHTDLGTAVDTWEKYLKVEGGNPDVGTAQYIVTAYIYLNDAGGAARTEQIVIDDKPSAGAYNQLAFFLYAAAKIDAADAAAKKAVSLSDPSQRQNLQKQFAQYHKQAVKLKKAQEAAAAAGQASGAPNPIENPFGSLGSTTPTP